MGLAELIGGWFAPPIAKHRLLLAKVGPVVVTEGERVYHNQVRMFAPPAHREAAQLGLLEARLHSVAFPLWVFLTRWENDKDSCARAIQECSALAQGTLFKTHFTDEFLPSQLAFIAEEVSAPSKLDRLSPGFIGLVKSWETALGYSFPLEPMAKEDRDFLTTAAISGVAARFGHLLRLVRQVK